MKSLAQSLYHSELRAILRISFAYWAYIYGFTFIIKYKSCSRFVVECRKEAVEGRLSVSIYVPEELSKKFRKFFLSTGGTFRKGNSSIIDILKLDFEEDEIHTHLLLKDLASTFYLTKEKLTEEEKKVFASSLWFPQFRLNLKYPTVFNLISLVKSPNSSWKAYLREGKDAFLIYNGDAYITEIRLPYRVESYSLWKDYLALIDDEKTLRIIYMFTLNEVFSQKSEGYVAVFSDESSFYLRYENDIVQSFTVNETGIYLGNIVQNLQELSSPSAPVKDIKVVGGRCKAIALSFSPDNKYLAVGFATAPDKVSVFSVGTFEKVWEQNFSSHPNQVSFSFDSRYMAIGFGVGYVQIYHTPVWQQVKRYSKDGWVSSVVFSPDGNRFAFGGKEGTVYVQNVGSWENVFTREVGGKIQTLSFDPLGRYLAVGDKSGKITILDTRGEVVKELDDYLGDHYYTLAFSSDGKLLAYAASDVDSTIRIRYVEDWREIGTVVGTGCVFFSGERRLLTTVGNEIIVYDTDGIEKLNATVSSMAPREMSIFPRKGKEVISVAISPDNKYLACGYEDDVATVLELGNGHALIKRAYKLEKFLWINPYLLFVDENEDVFIWVRKDGEFVYEGFLGSLSPSGKFEDLVGIEGWRIGKDFVLLADGKVAGSKGFQKHVNVLLGGMKADFESFKDIIMKNVLEVLK